MSLLHPARRTPVRVRDHLDGTLHPRRRERAVSRLQELRPRSVLFLCLGNVCRSPYAERVLASLEPAGVEIRSAGFIKPGRPAADLALEVAAARGIDHSDHRSRLVTREDMETADAVFFFDRHNKARLREYGFARWDRAFWLADLEPDWGGRRAILDPWGKPREEFERVFDRIDRCVHELDRLIPPAP